MARKWVNSVVFLNLYMSLLVNAIIILMFSDAAGALCRIIIGETKLSDTQNPSSCSHSERACDIVPIRVHVFGFLFHDLFEVPFEIITVMNVRHVLRIGTHGGKYVTIGIAICILRSSLLLHMLCKRNKRMFNIKSKGCNISRL